MPRITKFKKIKLNRSRYNEFQSATTKEDPCNNSSGDEAQLSPTTRAIQISPKDVDSIVMNVIQKREWKSKLELLEDKWRKECQQQGISNSSVDVAFEILRDIVHQGRGAKQCCGCCGADPRPMKNEYGNEDDEEDPEYVDSEEEEERKEKKSSLFGAYNDYEEERYSRSTRFCECPCEHCAINPTAQFSGEIEIEDDLIPLELKERLKAQLSRLENVPEEKKDWHPGSNHQVLDLIHPSLYCYVENVSVSDKAMEAEKPKTDHYWWRPQPAEEKPKTNRCQWLPVEFEIEDDEVSRIASYINNLDEITHKDLYQTIQEIFSKFLPMVGYFINFDDRLQVIVKAANIIVSPDKPFYSGGTFHTEGMDYEHIAATCIYYYQSENVKDSYLEFRESISEPYGYGQDDVKGCFEMYGLHDGDLQFRSLGAIETKEDRCIVFPNTVQHRVRHFFPKNPSLPAVRKILVFFVVDPNHPIISTQNVDIQRMDFLINKYFLFNKLLPFHVVHKILSFLPHFTRAEALKYREDLMNQRKFFVNEQNVEVEREFSLCEH
ncbi:hypothetical protein C9374_013892 [Naegleria lovaniensis]|uniref:DUF4246 domain-containing protein n=1 Tax=Naegleria lovaniensis TaxID=51637 RepID=A0AA88GUX4_NAELO|nr:uncharacterized protein C9374_013892 [Naegleria lovaniensis]KAG2389332.1 hypothetical protein C9374_013892 [Naegleria lovaniensis]